MPAQTSTGFGVIDTYNLIRKDMDASSDYEEELLDLDQQQGLPQFAFLTSASSSRPTSFPALMTRATGCDIIQQASNLYSSSSSSPSPSPSSPYSSSSSSSSSPAPVSPHCPLPTPQSAAEEEEQQQQQQQQQMTSFAEISFLDEFMMRDDDPMYSLCLTPLQPVPSFSQPQLSSSASASTTTTTTFVAGAASSGCTVVQRGGGGGEGRDQQLLLHPDVTELCDLDKHQSFYDDRVFKDDGKDWVQAQLGLMEEVGHPAQGAQPPKPTQDTGPSLTELGPMVHSEHEDIINIFVGIRKEITQECKRLGISPNPKEWSARDSQAWTVYMLDKYQKVDDCSASVAMPGSLLCQKSEQEMLWMSPMSGEFLHQQLHMWLALQATDFLDPKPEPPPQSLIRDVQLSPQSSVTLSYLPPSVSPAPSMGSVCSPQSSSSSSSSSLSSSDAEMLWKQDNSEEDFFRDSIANLSPPELPKSTKPSSKQHSGRPGKQIRLWEFLKELLEDSDPSMKWLDRARGIFKIEDSTRVSRLWGIRKNHPEMNYDKLSRSIRQYYKKGIIKKTTQTRRLVYQICERYL